MMNFLLDSNKVVASAMLKSCRKIFLKPDATNFSWIVVEFLLRSPIFQQKYDNECQIVGHEARIQCKLDPIIINAIWQEIARMQCHDTFYKRKFTITTVVLATKV